MSRIEDGIGDACWNDNDNDTIINQYDNCPDNNKIWTTDFREYITVDLDPIGNSQEDPIWKIHHEGAEIQEILNSDPGVAIGGCCLDGCKKRNLCFERIPKSIGNTTGSFLSFALHLFYQLIIILVINN